jgi:hypothetical protein
MTFAPTDLLTVRQYLLSHTGLPGDAVGIVGDPAHASTGGYHEGNDDLARVGRLSSDYSKRESVRDRPGTNNAAALDIGDFIHAGRTLRQLTLWLVARCVAGDPRTRDVREVIYTPDGQTVHRWDRLGIRSTGDDSHLIHTHLSFFRDSEGRRAAPDNILGLLAEFFEGVPVAFLDDRNAAALAYRMDAIAAGSDTARGGPVVGEPMWLVTQIKALVAGQATSAARETALTAAVQALAAGGGSVDAAAVIAHVDQVAAAESQTVASLMDHIRHLEGYVGQLLAQQAAAAQATLAVTAPPAAG